MIRIFDFFFSLFGIIFLFPLFILILIVGLFENGSPIFSQKELVAIKGLFII